MGKESVDYMDQAARVLAKKRDRQKSENVLRGRLGNRSWIIAWNTGNRPGRIWKPGKWWCSEIGPGGSVFFSQAR